MKRFLLAGLILTSTFAAYTDAKDKGNYQTGVLLQMESTSCGYAEKGSKTVAGEIFGTDGEHKKTQEMLCPEYILQTSQLIYRIRPKDDKHPVLLPIGESARFRIHKDKLLLQVPETGEKEREYIVVSMTPRGDVPGNGSQSAAKAAPLQ